ncbi:MAG: transposase [Gemmatimonadaceae bacterium]
MDPTAPLLPLRPGQAERRTHDEQRHGITTLFAAMNVAEGKVVTALKRRHRSVEFRRFLDQIDASLPPELDVHIILDNDGTHQTPLIRT